MTTRRWLELDDDGRIVLVKERDPGDGFDVERVTRVVRDDYDCPPFLRDEWHRLDAERRDARAFGAACKEEAVGEWERTRGV